MERGSDFAGKLEKAQSQLGEDRHDFIAHVVVEHHGVPPTSCHRCMTLKQYILSGENNIKRLERDLSIPPIS